MPTWERKADPNLMVPKFKPKLNPAKYVDLGGKKVVGSLRENGKSRADLWAFAGLVAVEFSAVAHNLLCDNANTTNFCGGNLTSHFHIH